MQISRAERNFYLINNIVMFILVIITVYPIWHVIMFSISEPKLTYNGGLFVFPKGFSFSSFNVLFKDGYIFSPYRNSLFRVVVGTFVNLVFTTSLAYPLSRKRLKGRTFFTLMIFFTMLFSGGLIPTYLIVKSFGMIDSLWALIIPYAVSPWNMFIMKNYFQSLPNELEESAIIDGASPSRTLIQVILPVAKPVVSAIVLFYAVWHWNSFFDAVVYITSTNKQVLPQFLRVMMSSSMSQQLQQNSDSSLMGQVTEESVKAAAIVASVIPMLIIYPYMQKHFVKGILIGSVKG